MASWLKNIHVKINEIADALKSNVRVSPNDSPETYIKSLNKLGALMKARTKPNSKGKSKQVVGKKARATIAKSLASTVTNPEAEKTKRSQTRNRVWSAAAQTIGTGANAATSANSAIQATTFSNQLAGVGKGKDSANSNGSKNPTNNPDATSNDPTSDGNVQYWT